MLKHALISDEDYWERVKQIDFANANWDEIIRHSISIKANVVDDDPLENGRRKILNFYYRHKIWFTLLVIFSVPPLIYKIIQGYYEVVVFVLKLWGD